METLSRSHTTQIYIKKHTLCSIHTTNNYLHPTGHCFKIAKTLSNDPFYLIQVIRWIQPIKTGYE